MGWPKRIQGLGASAPCKPLGTFGGDAIHVGQLNLIICFDRQAKGPVAEDDNSMWGCLKRIEDPDTGAPLTRAKLASEAAGIVLGALDTTSQTCAITLCGPPHAQTS